MSQFETLPNNACIVNLGNNVNIDDNCAGVGITPITIVGSIVVVE
jgi:hypothetical protein